MLKFINLFKIHLLLEKMFGTLFVSDKVIKTKKYN